MMVCSSNGSCCLETVEQSLRNSANSSEGGTVRKGLDEVFALLYAGTEKRIQWHCT